MKSVIVIIFMIFGYVSPVVAQQPMVPPNYEWQHQFYDPVQQPQYDPRTIRELGEGLELGTRIWNEQQHQTQIAESTGREPRYPSPAAPFVFPDYSYQRYLEDLRRQRAAWQAYLAAIEYERRKQLEVARLYNLKNPQQPRSQDPENAEEPDQNPETPQRESSNEESLSSTPPTTETNRIAQTPTHTKTTLNGYEGETTGLTKDQLFALESRKLDIWERHTEQNQFFRWSVVRMIFEFLGFLVSLVFLGKVTQWAFQKI